MRVFVKDMSGNYLHATTPRKARILLKEKKAVIESNNPFTIRLLFSVSECGLKDSESLSKLESDLASEKDITMYENEETNVLSNKLNEFYDFTLRSVRYILNSTDVDKVTWYTASGENDPNSFANTLYSAGLMLYTKNHRVIGNFVLTGKRGFDILKKIGKPRFDFEERHGRLDHTMRVHYIPSMDDNRFIVSVYEPINFDNGYNGYKVYYTIYEDMDAMVVGEIVDGESPKENIEVKSEMDDKCETVSDNSIKLDSKTHLIFGSTGCGKSTYLRQLIKDKISNGIDVCLLTNPIYARTYFRDEVDHLHIILVKDIPFDGTLGVAGITKALLNVCIGKVSRSKLKVIAVDGVDLTSINNDYVEEEYFREFSRWCKENQIDLLFTKGVDGEKEIAYHKLPFIYEKFSDIITIIK